MTTHISADVQRITSNASCRTISGERTEQLDIFCRVTGFTSDFVSFIDVELIWFFHGAIQLLFCFFNAMLTLFVKPWDDFSLHSCVAPKALQRHSFNDIIIIIIFMAV